MQSQKETQRNRARQEFGSDSQREEIFVVIKVSDGQKKERRSRRTTWVESKYVTWNEM